MGMMGLKGASIYAIAATHFILRRCGPGEAGWRKGFGRRSFRRTVVGLG